jgi:putative transposase
MMDIAVKMAPTVGIFALCAALGLSRATFYRHRRAAAGAVVAPSASLGNADGEAAQPSGRSPVAVCGLGTEGATASSSELAVDAARNDDADPLHVESVATVVASSATALTTELAIADEVDETCRDAARPLLVETPAVVVAPEAPAVVVAPEAPAVVAPEATPVVVAPTPAKKPPARKLPDEERAAILAVLNEDRFCNLAPAAVWATLLDEGKHLCSERTMYRILDENRELRERRNQRRHPTYVAPELMATGPKQLWSWDITKLKTFVKSQYLHLYVILDVFSRYAVGWMVAERESGELAKALIEETCERQGITPGELTFHADNGAAMVSQPVAFLLASLGVVKSHSRPHVSDDNPFSEAQFKTLKYRPDFPARFGSLEQARTFLREFFDWYNTRHHHDALALLTPYDVHHGLVAERLAQRARVLDAAYAAHPERFVRGKPEPTAPPTTVWINPPKTTTETQEPQA